MLFGTENAEMQILNTIHDAVQSRFMDFIMPKITFWGDAGLLWIVLTAVMLCVPKYRRCGMRVAAGLLCGMIFGNLLLKPLIGRPRPCWLYEVELIAKIPSDFSFPSGHTYASFIAAFLIFGYDRCLGVPALVAAALIAFSRMYLFAHFPTDVLGGIVLAALISAGISAADRKIVKKIDRQNVN